MATRSSRCSRRAMARTKRSIVPFASRARWVVVLAATAWIVAGAVPAHPAPRDPAPIPDEVVEKVVRRPLFARPVAPAETLARHLDDMGTLLAQLETETRNRGGRDQDPVAATTTLMLVGSKLQE